MSNVTSIHHDEKNEHHYNTIEQPEQEVKIESKLAVPVVEEEKPKKKVAKKKVAKKKENNLEAPIKVSGEIEVTKESDGEDTPEQA